MDPMPTVEARHELYADAYKGATTSYFAKVPKKRRRARHRAAILARYAPGKRFLDVGCSGGFIVEAMAARGFEAHGLDPDGGAIAYARRESPHGHYHHGYLDDLGADIGTFDVVYCSEVIEHAPAPHAFMAGLAALVRTGGILYLTTPDIGHPLRPRNIAKWDAFCPPAHCLYFNRTSLDRLLAAHGFETVRRFFALKPGIRLIVRKTA
ncbi:MAG: methyltransferase domain-containing protein [Alphaproteobacteria bacterium]|nr:methyltransferase domain-containing protein [Alphaproteobacteria bacterium]